MADINGDNKPDIVAAGDAVAYLENQITNAQPNGWTVSAVAYSGSTFRPTSSSSSEGVS